MHPVLKARLRALAAIVAGTLVLGAAHADEAWPKQFTIGYQKFGTLIILKSRGDLDKRLAAHGVTVKWAEFPAGAPILEGMNGGSVDFGITGETPPVFAQAAAGSVVRYIAYEPAAPAGEAILVPKNSPLKTLADLKGKRVAVAKGSNSYYLLVQALKKAGLTLDDINVAFLKPADANAAFAQGGVDAWSIWDYYYAAGQAQSGARVLASGEGLIDNHAFFLASKDEIAKYPEVLKIALEETAKVDLWTREHPDEAAALLSQQVGIDAAILKTAIQRSGFGPKPLGPEVIAAQQRMADALYALKQLPNAITVQDAVVTLPQ
ncbi:aliphatic sulfonate ABC transporter substrate-binding protein [Nevskia soli]|uniref:sulfonate ABC transporter substrate-binding protein n=1 Tax=Nevskia soli TaxID=418856 RepID=UPI0004A6B160